MNKWWSSTSVHYFLPFLLKPSLKDQSVGSTLEKVFSLIHFCRTAAYWDRTADPRSYARNRYATLVMFIITALLSREFECLLNSSSIFLAKSSQNDDFWPQKLSLWLCIHSGPRNLHSEMIMLYNHRYLVPFHYNSAYILGPDIFILRWFLDQEIIQKW